MSKSQWVTGVGIELSQTKFWTAKNYRKIFIIEEQTYCKTLPLDPKTHPIRQPSLLSIKCLLNRWFLPLVEWGGWCLVREKGSLWYQHWLLTQPIMDHPRNYCKKTAHTRVYIYFFVGWEGVFYFGKTDRICNLPVLMFHERGRVGLGWVRKW